MPGPIKVVDIDVGEPLADIGGLAGYVRLQGLVRLHGSPIGYVTVPVRGDVCLAAEISAVILAEHADGLTRELQRRELLRGVDDPSRETPLVTVAVCTRDRVDQLSRCLDSLTALDYPSLDLLLIDNAPSHDGAERLVRASYPHVRYIREPRPGLDRARNRAIREARGEIIAFTDDDSIADRRWVSALTEVFASCPDVMAVTGLVVPLELDTESQILFEECGGFGRGFKRRWCRVDPTLGKRAASQYGGTGQFGTGANMAFRTRVFERIGLFDPALDVGTVTNGGGDLEMFFRILKEGHTLAYEPRAIVRHRHRRRYSELREQIANNGVGLYSYFAASWRAYPEERPAFLRLGAWWLWHRGFRRFLKSCFRPRRVPRDLVTAELRGSFIGTRRYRRALSELGDDRRDIRARPRRSDPRRDSPTTWRSSVATPVRELDLAKPLPTLAGLESCRAVRVRVFQRGHAIGAVEITHLGQPISRLRLADAIVEGLGSRLATPGLYLDAAGPAPASLPPEVPVSIVVATLDRPDALRRCLRDLTAQRTPRDVEIVVVDNNPSSQLTPPVVSEFPAVTLVREPRRGLSYARNAGFIASRGAILVATDDDVTLPPDWLERLIAPFTRNDVMIVTGNVQPLELATKAQRLFELYGGLGRGRQRREASREWFDSFWTHAVPTWTLGATANAAFRASLFRDPQVGMLPEELGPGTPSGVGEDTYLFYRTLKRGYTIVYEPAASVRHDHRHKLSELRRLIYHYSKGHVAYHLFTLLRDGDLRSLRHLLLSLPGYHLRRAVKRVILRSPYPLWLTLVEVAGNLAGPWGLWRSIRRVNRIGRAPRPGSAVPIPQPAQSESLV